MAFDVKALYHGTDLAIWAGLNHVGTEPTPGSLPNVLRSVERRMSSEKQKQVGADRAPGRNRRLVALVAMVVLSLTALIVATDAPVTVAADAPVVHVLYFYDPYCGSCEQVHDEVIEPLQAAYGAQLQIEARSLSTSEGYYLMLAMEAQYGITAGSIPEVYIGNEVLVGPSEIASHLQERIDYYLQAGGVAVPTLAPTATPAANDGPVVAECDVCEDRHETLSNENAPAIHAAYFFQAGCDVCERSEHDLEYIQSKYPQLVIQRFDIREEAALSQYLGERVGVPADRLMTAPALFVGDEYLLGDDIREPAIEDLLSHYLADGAPETWTDWENQRGSVEQSIVERFRSMGIWTVVGAGLLDGINPCAFATMIFLISYLSLRKRQGRELLLTGAAFTLGVFITYLGVGFGFLRFLASLDILQQVGRWVYGVTAALCLGLALGSLLDYRKARSGRLDEMSLKLPDRMRGWIKVLIREGSGSRYFVLAALGLGFGVSLVELACTGQVYLPTLMFMLSVPQWHAQATLALVLYNVMFIVPLVVVFGLVYLGTTSEQLIAWMTKRAAAVKLGMAVLFLLLAAWMIYGAVLG